MRRSSDWDNIGLSCRLNRLNKHSRWDKWQDKVSFCSLIRFNWRVPARVPLFSLGLKAPRSGPCGHSGRLSEVVLTHYRRREVRNSIYRYRKIHIDYRSKFSYRFISIIYGNTNKNVYSINFCFCFSLICHGWVKVYTILKAKFFSPLFYFQNPLYFIGMLVITITNESKDICLHVVSPNPNGLI